MKKFFLKNKKTRFMGVPTKKSGLNFYRCVKISNIRKSKIFIKSRFSRNRQSCRPIVYWSIWVNVAFIGFSQLNFYGFKFSLGYIPITLILSANYFIFKRFISSK